jgi:uncharacterized membrane protein HdeD (DUF308 family)
MNDLRTPIGTFFLILGALLLTVPGAHAPLTDVPVNLYTGVAMLLFGAVMLTLAFRRRKG